MNIVVIGMGYVGLSNAILLAKKNKVTAIDIDSKKIKLVNNGISPIKDSYIEDYLQNHDLDLKASLFDETIFLDADMFIIATPTDYNSELNSFDTSSVESNIAKIVRLRKDVPIIIKSTIPVGFSDEMIVRYNYEHIYFSPEFLREGHALEDNLYPSRIVIGVNKKDDVHIPIATRYINLLKESALKDDILSYIVGLKEAESIKLFANTFLAIRVAYFNELDTYALSKGLETSDIINGICSDPRIGNFYNNPSFGYGGYCLPKDTKQLKANFSNIPNNIIYSVVDSNRTRKDFIANQILLKAGYLEDSDNSHIVIGIYKLIMKSGSDNFRNSSIQGIIKRLRKKDVKIIIYEPSLKSDEFYGLEVIKDINIFKSNSTLVVANRFDEELSDIKEKVFTRDVFSRD